MMFLRRLSTVVAAVSVICAPAVSATPAGADLEVHLGAVGSLLLPAVSYSVTVTNHGPAALDSATVAVKLDSRAWFMTSGPPCTLDKPTTTLTCPFGSLASGATATDKASVNFNIRSASSVDATATLATSTPPDPNSANNSDSHHCFWDGSVGIGLPPGKMTC
jgi:hypothetical protein